MSFIELVEAGFGSLLQIPVIRELSGAASDRAVEMLKRHFVYSSNEVAETFQESYSYAMTTISAGLSLQSRPSAGVISRFFSFFQHAGDSRVSKEFSEPMSVQYIRPFAEDHDLSNKQLEAFCVKGAKICKELSAKSEKSLPLRDFPDLKIATLMNKRFSLNVSQSITSRIAQQERKIDPLILDFFEYRGLLGNAVLHFFRERMRQDPRVEATINALRQEGLLADVKDLKVGQRQLYKALSSQIQSLEERITEQQMRHNQAQAERDEEGREFYAGRIKQFQKRMQEHKDAKDNAEEALKRAQQSWAALGGRLDLFEQRFGKLCDVISQNFEEIQGKLDGLEAGQEEIKEYLGKILNSVQSSMKLSNDALGELKSGLNVNRTIEQRFIFDRTKPIGHGSVGQVFKAVTKGTEKTRAIKLLHPYIEKDEKIVTRFLRESMILYQMKYCENIVKIYSSGGGRDREFFIEMEYLDGHTLQYFIEKQRDFYFSELLDMSLQLCRGLEACHMAGIVHRDINPRNIMLTTDNKLKLMDFGVAKIIGLEGLTLHGDQIGNIQYMAPEQDDGLAHNVDRPADIYSVGAILYHLCTGRAPSKIHKISPIREKNHNIPEWFDELVLLCLQESPEERPQDAKDLRERIQNEGLSSKDLQFMAYVQLTFQENQSLLTSNDRKYLLHAAHLMGLKETKALQLYKKETKGARRPKHFYQEWLKQEIVEKEPEVLENAETNEVIRRALFAQGVRLELEPEVIHELIEAILPKPIEILPEETYKQTDLSGVNLCGVKLKKACLRGANLQGADLRRTNLVDADLQQANLQDADLQNADLSGANLRAANFAQSNLENVHLTCAIYDAETIWPEGFDSFEEDAYCIGPEASLWGAELSEIDLQGVDLQGADLESANLSGTDLSGANLSQAQLNKANLRRGTDLTQAILDGVGLEHAIYDTETIWPNGFELPESKLYCLQPKADLRKANLRDADLSGAILSKANFSAAELGGADLGQADVSGANFKKADLRRANLRHAKLLGANLSSAKLQGAIFTESVYDENTKWPSDFQPEKVGCIKLPDA